MNRCLPSESTRHQSCSTLSRHSGSLLLSGLFRSYSIRLGPGPHQTLPFTHVLSALNRHKPLLSRGVGQFQAAVLRINSIFSLCRQTSISAFTTIRFARFLAGNVGNSCVWVHETLSQRLMLFSYNGKFVCGLEGTVCTTLSAEQKERALFCEFLARNA